MSENETQTMEQTEMPGFYSKKFKKEALKQLNGRWTTPVLITLAVTVITSFLVCLAFPWEFYGNLISSAINGYEPSMSSFPWVRYYITLLLIMIIEPVVEIAQLYTFPILFKNKEPLKFSEFITGFSLWGKALGVFWWMYLWLILWGMLGLFAGFLGGFLIAAICYAITQSSSAIAVILPITGYIGFFIVLVIKAYQYSVASFAIVDNTDVKVTQSLKISKALTKGYKWKLFCLDLSFIGWQILAGMVYIGNLWLKPYQTSAKYAAYLYLLNDYNKKMDQAKIDQPKPRAIEDEPVSAEVDTTDSNQV